MPSRLLMFWPVIGDAELTTADAGVSDGSSEDAEDQRDALLQADARRGRRAPRHPGRGGE